MGQGRQSSGRDASSRHRHAGAGALALALLSPLPVLAESAIDAARPCMELRADLPAYVAAFEAAGWTRADGAARQTAAEGPAEAYGRLLTFPAAPESQEEVEAAAAEARAAIAERVGRMEILTRGPAAVAIEGLFDGNFGSGVTCILAAAHLPGAGDPFRGAVHSDFTALDTAEVALPVPDGAGEFRVDLVRLTPGFTPFTPTPGTEAIIVNLRMAPR